MPLFQTQIRASIEILWKSRIFVGDGQSNRRRWNFSWGVKGAMQIQPFYSIWARIRYFFSLLKIDVFKGLKNLLFFFFHYVYWFTLSDTLSPEMQLCSVKLSAASLLSGAGLRDQQLRSNFQPLQMFVSDTVTHQIFCLYLQSWSCVHATCSPRNVNFFMQFPILYLIGPTFPKECSRRWPVHFQDQQFFTKERIAFVAVL